MDTLLVTPNAAMIFKERGYHTAHVGKWHLGGMTPLDLDSRSRKRCDRPGIHQHGFIEYVAMAEGPESARLTSLLPGNTLYSQGYSHLIRNEEPFHLDFNYPMNASHDLTHVQASQAIRIIEENALRGKPLYLHVWFDSPHGPWEVIKPFHQQYQSKISDEESIPFKYASMVSSLDHNVGRILSALDRLGLTNNTLVVFVSDNGPEKGTGTAGPFKEGKRSLMEGGVRVPAILKWEGVIPPGSSSNQLVVATDLLPTFLDAAGIESPENLRLDGRSRMSLLRDPASFDDSGAIDDGNAVLWRKAIWWKGYKLHETAKGAVGKFFDMQLDCCEDLDLAANLTARRDASVRSSPAGELRRVLDDWSFLTEENRRNVSVMNQAKDRMATLLIAFRTKGDKPYRNHLKGDLVAKDACGVPNASMVARIDFGNSIEAPRYGLGRSRL